MDMVGSENPLRKPAGVKPRDRLCKEQPQVAAASTFLQVCGYLLAGKSCPKRNQGFPAILCVRIQSNEACLAFPVENVCAQGDFPAQVGKQVTHVEVLMNAHVPPVLQLLGVEIPALDKALGQHPGRSSQLLVWQPSLPS